MIRISLSGVKKTFAKARADIDAEARLKMTPVVVALKQELVRNTPIDTGEARDGWEMKPTPTGFALTNDVEHVKFLNEGSSQQAPSYFIEAIALKYGKPLGLIVQTV